jgi:hypothetical protein
MIFFGLTFGIDQQCDVFLKVNTPNCGYDGGDCIEWNKYPDCKGTSENFAGEYRLFLYSKIMDEIILVVN